MTLDQISQAELGLFNTFMPSGTKAQSMGNMDVADETERESKSARTENQGKGNQGGGREPGRGKRGWQASSWGSGWGTAPKHNQWSVDDCNDIESLKAYIAQLQRLILRHEDAISLLRIETSYVAHFRISTPEAIVTGIYKPAAGWKQAKESQPESLDKPLRATLITCVFLELHTRVANLKQDQVDKLKTLKWFDDATTTWSYLRWNAESKQLMKDEDRPGMKTEDVLNTLNDILRAAPRQHAVARFHPTRPLAQEMSGETLTFLMQFGTHNDHAEKLCACMDKLSGLSVTQLIGMGVKPDRLRRSTLANQIAASFLG